MVEHGSGGECTLGLLKGALAIFRPLDCFGFGGRQGMERTQGSSKVREKTAIIIYHTQESLHSFLVRRLLKGKEIGDSGGKRSDAFRGHQVAQIPDFFGTERAFLAVDVDPVFIKEAEKDLEMGTVGIRIRGGDQYVIEVYKSKINTS